MSWARRSPASRLTLEGRYYATLDPSFKDASRVSPTVSQQANWKPKNENASVLVGLRYAFYTPAPPPAPVVAAARRPGPGPHLPGLLRLGQVTT